MSDPQYQPFVVIPENSPPFSVVRDPESPVDRVVIVTYEKGDKGDPGIQGNPGNIGVQGPPGIQGPPGTVDGATLDGGNF